MNFRQFFTLTIIIMCFFASTGQEETIEMTRWQMLKYDGASSLGSITNAFTQPIRWKGKDWVTLGAVAAGNTLLFLIDEPAYDYFRKQDENLPQVFKDFGYLIGKPFPNYGLTGSIYAIGIITRSEKIRKTGVLLIASATTAGIIQSAVKTIAGRARPMTGRGNDHFLLWDERAGYHSFPSGHTVLSFTTAHALAKQFKNLWIKGGIYALGMISPISRLSSGAHWLTDVGLGIALSIVVVDGVDNFLRKKERYTYNPKKLGLRWKFSLGANKIGIVGNF